VGSMQRPFVGLSLILGLLALGAGTAGSARAAQEPPVRVVVALLPFQIHGAAELQYLETTLVDLLTTRLEASGEVEVVESVVVREALVAYGDAEMAETEVRRLAREVGADYVVTGSLTELAGRFSLDVRVTPVETAFTSRTLVFTAQDEDDLLDRVNELSERVVAVVTAAPSVVVSQVRVEGAGPRAARLREALTVREGRPYSTTEVRRDVEALRGMPEVAAVTSETERDASGVVVIYRVVSAEELGTPIEPPSSEEADVVADVRVRGNRRIETAAIRTRIRTEPGSSYDPRAVSEDVQAVYEMGFFRDVRVFSEESLDGRVLIFEVKENPVVRQVTIVGNDSLSADEIRDTLTITTGATLDHPLLFENAQRIEALYRSRGYYLARVGHEIERLGEEAVGIHFRVTEGDKLRLTEIRFEGNEHFSDDELLRGLQTKPWRLWSHVTRFLDNSGTYAEPVFMQDLRRVEKKYADAGYVRVRVGEPQVDPREEGLVVTVGIEEGSRFHVGEIDVVGDDTVDLEALRQKLVLAEDEVFGRSSLTTDVESLTRHYTDRGFYFASVQPLTQVDGQEKKVDVTFQVQKGPLFFVREIDFQGNTQTVDPVLRREMQLVEGQLYSARALRISEARIRRLGFFEEVNFAAEPTDRPDQIDVDVQVVERPTGSISFGAGFSSQDSFVLNGGISQSNLFGRGYGVQLSADIGGRSQRVFGSFTDPYFMGTEFSLGVTGFFTRVEFIDFEQDQTGLDLVLGHALNPEGTRRGSLRYSFSSRDIVEDETANASSVIFREILSDNLSASVLGLTLRSDTRNDQVAPTAGGRWTASVDFGGLGGFTKFARFEGRFERFFQAPEWWPVFAERSTFMFGARFGWAVPFNDVSDFDVPDTDGIFAPVGADTALGPNRGGGALDDIDDDLTLPISERYFLGGLGPFQLRGFRARSVGPRRPVLKRTGLVGTGNEFAPVGTQLVAEDDGFAFPCVDDVPFNQGDQDGECNDIDDEDIEDFEDLDETDVVGGNKFLSLTAEYRFPISEALGLVGIFFLDAGNAFAENESMLDVGNWRFGTGFGGLWFSPFGPLQGFVGIPLDPLEVEDSQVFEFSVGGANF